MGRSIDRSPPAGLMLGVTFNHGDARDHSPNDHVPTVTGATIGTDASFDGSNDYIGYPDSANLYSGTAFSVMMWGKAASAANSKYILGQYYYATNNRSWAFFSDGVGGTFNVVVTSDGSATLKKTYSALSGTFLNGSWHSLGFTWDSGTLKLYQDGAEESVTKFSDDSFTSMFEPTSDVMIGSAGSIGADALHWGGNVDNVELHSRVLTLKDFQIYHQQGRR